MVVRRDVTFNENDFGQSKSEVHKELISYMKLKNSTMMSKRIGSRIIFKKI